MISKEIQRLPSKCVIFYLQWITGNGNCKAYVNHFFFHNVIRRGGHILDSNVMFNTAVCCINTWLVSLNCMCDCISNSCHTSKVKKAIYRDTQNTRKREANIFVGTRSKKCSHDEFSNWSSDHLLVVYFAFNIVI